MADPSTDSPEDVATEAPGDSLSPEQLDSVAGGAFDAFMNFEADAKPAAPK